MSYFGRIVENAYLEAAIDRLRAGIWRMRGASLGAGTRIGPRAMVSKPWRVRMGERSIIEAGAYLKVAKETGRIDIGDRSFIGFGSELNSILEIRIGSSVLIAPYCFLSDHNHRYQKGKLIAKQGCDAAPVVIHDDVWLGCGVVVLKGVQIGTGAVVGAGSVVTKDLAPYTVSVGSPASVIGHRSEFGLLKGSDTGLNDLAEPVDRQATERRFRDPTRGLG